MGYDSNGLITLLIKLTLNLIVSLSSLLRQPFPLVINFDSIKSIHPQFQSHSILPIFCDSIIDFKKKNY